MYEKRMSIPNSSTLKNVGSRTTNGTWDDDNFMTWGIPPRRFPRLLRRMLLRFGERHDFHEYSLLVDAQSGRRSLIQRRVLGLESYTSKG